jgi:lipopolysaccharide export system permease protein
LILVGVQTFILFVNQLSDLGKADYDLMQAAIFVLLQLPYQVYILFPMASLMGALIGLGVLASHNELVVMRAAGVSIGQISIAVLKIAMFLILVVTLLGESFIPRLMQWSVDQKMQAINGGQSLRTAKGLWLRYHRDYIFIGSILQNDVLENVQQFHFDEQHHLQVARTINRIEFNQGLWQAHGVDETRFSSDHIHAQHVDQMDWDVKLKPRSLHVSSRRPDEMTLLELHHYLHDQKMSRQAAYNYQLLYLQRLIQPFTTMVMMILAIPFIFGPLRSSTMGLKLLAGSTVGFSFYLIAHFFGPLCMLIQWPVEIAAFAPTVVFAGFSLYLMSRL